MMNGTRLMSTDNVDSGDTAFMILATTFVFIQTPAMGIAQAGLLRRKNVLSMITQTMVGVCVGSLLFMLVGFSLLWGPTMGGIIGEPWHYPMLQGVKLNESTPKWNDDGTPLQTIPEITYASFQMMFALMTPVIVTGAWAEKFTMYGFLTFVVVWPLFVYYPLAHWMWNPHGWLAVWGVEDFAGGMVIHISSGFSGLVVAAMLRHRRYMEDASKTHHNLPLFATGSFFIWAGWYFFNGGSASRAGAQAATAMMNTHIAACTGSFFWMIASYWEDRKFRLGYFINGALAGLAGITAGSGFTTPQGAFAIGLCAAASAYFTSGWVARSKTFDDVLDCFALQGAPGVVGSLLVGVFSHKDVAGRDGLVYGGTAELLGKQFVGVVVTVLLSSVMTGVLIAGMRKAMGPTTFQVDDVVDAVGLDLCQVGEAGYDGMLFDEQDKMLLADKLCSAIDNGDFDQFMWLKSTVYDAMGMHIGAKNRAGRTAFHAVAASAAGLFWTPDKAKKAQLELQFGRMDLKSDACFKWLSDNSEAVRVINILLDSKCNVNEADNFKHTPLQYALDMQGDCQSNEIEQRHVTGVVEYLSSKGAMTCPDAAGERLNSAVKAADMGLLRIVLSWPGVVDLVDYDTRSALHIATEECIDAIERDGDITTRLEVVEFLLFNNANRHIRDRWGKAALDLVQKTLNVYRQRASSNAGSGSPRETLGMKRTRERIATALANLDLLEEALLCPMPTEAFKEKFDRMMRGGSRLSCPHCHMTIKHRGSPGMAPVTAGLATPPGKARHSPEFLGSNTSHPVSEEEELPVAEDHPLVVHDLATSHDVAEQALSYAASASGKEPLQRLGLESHQYASIRDAHGLNLLHVACLHGNEEIVEWLISPAPVGINAVALMLAADASGHSPMFTAISACHSHDKIPRKLRDRYRELHNDEDWPVDHKLGYVLCLAAKENNRSFLNSLILAGASVADFDYDGRTALHLAVCEGHLELVEWLLLQDPRHRALLTKDRVGHTPLDDALLHKEFARRDVRRNNERQTRAAFKTARVIHQSLNAAVDKYTAERSRHMAGGLAGSILENDVAEENSPYPPPLTQDHPYAQDAREIAMRSRASSVAGLDRHASFVPGASMVASGLSGDLERIVQRLLLQEIAKLGLNGIPSGANSPGASSPVAEFSPVLPIPKLAEVLSVNSNSVTHSPANVSF